MAEKKSEKKLLALLVILVALSLVVDLLSLNVLYSIAVNEGLKGELATFSLDSCLDDCVEEEANCWGSDEHCSEEFLRCEDDCYDQSSNYSPPSSLPDFKNEPWFQEGHFPYSSDYKKDGVG